MGQTCLLKRWRLWKVNTQQSLRTEAILRDHNQWHATLCFLTGLDLELRRLSDTTAVLLLSFMEALPKYFNIMELNSSVTGELEVGLIEQEHSKTELKTC